MQSSTAGVNKAMKEKTFGNRVAALRKEKGMTQFDLAEKMGVTDKAVSKWERFVFSGYQLHSKTCGIFCVA